MKIVLPQEIEAWYLIPAIRRELSIILVEKEKLKQKEAAEILGITEAAVSQYIKQKRGAEVEFSEKEKEGIQKCARELTKTKNQTKIRKLIFGLCVNLRGSKSICDLHRLKDKEIPKKCDICK